MDKTKKKEIKAAKIAAKKEAKLAKKNKKQVKVSKKVKDNAAVVEVVKTEKDKKSSIRITF